ncbi:MAG: DUF4834 family protein [Bacteroidota bacterium]
MRDVFYTLLVVWIIYRVLNAFSSVKNKYSNTSQRSDPPPRKDETIVSDASAKKKNFGDNEGEYVDFEEIKD